ncbi:MAG: hypothetical protein P8J59_02865 [Phycisphaerales bacterium]|nr:hypothetical protein [Phycisphaerales bacterium]
MSDAARVKHGVVKHGVVKLVEAVRIFGTGLGFYMAYAAWGDSPSPDAIRILTLAFAISMCGTCAFEGLFLAKTTAREKGFDQAGGGSVGPYQRQNTMWFLVATVVGVVWATAFPDDVRAFLLYVVLICGFFLLSAVNHAWQAIAHRNMTWQNLDRPILAVAMAGGSVPIITSYL